jgi:DNA-binding MarR family transcriptional regulator
MRAVAEYLLIHGPATTPHIARARGVSRQHIQVQVNSLEQLRLVAIEVNPEHRRSVIVRLTSSGRALIERMRRRERQYLAKIVRSASSKDLAHAAKTLASIRHALEAAS